MKALLLLVLYTELSWTGKGMVANIPCDNVRSKLINSTTPHAVSSSSCQVYPAEYAYHSGSVSRAESDSANCRRYQSGFASYNASNQYVRCDGTQLRLTDSDLGSEQCTCITSDYYAWTAGTSNSQLLFTFPTTVNLTTITLHYYSDSVSSLTGLILYAVPDDFNVWDAPYASYTHINIAQLPPDSVATGMRSVNVNFNLNTKKVLMYKYHSSFMLAVSEVEFFSDNCSKLSSMCSSIAIMMES